MLETRRRVLSRSERRMTLSSLEKKKKEKNDFIFIVATESVTQLGLKYSRSNKFLTKAKEMCKDSFVQMKILVPSETIYTFYRRLVVCRQIIPSTNQAKFYPFFPLPRKECPFLSKHVWPEYPITIACTKREWSERFPEFFTGSVYVLMHEHP